MKLVGFGTSGVEVSEFCLGTMNFADRCDFQDSERIVNQALDLGINFFDTAPMYSAGQCEEFLGKMLKGKREKVFIMTKVHKGIDRASILESIDESLSRLQTDHVDLFLIHWPVPGMNVTEVMGSLNEIVKSGKSRFVGCSNYPAWLFAHSNSIAQQNGWVKMSCNSIPYNLFERGVEVEILPQAAAEGFVINPYRVLAIGLLTGRYNSTAPIPDSARGLIDARVITWYSQYKTSLDRFVQYAKVKNISPSSLAIAWVRHNKAVSCPIIGVTSVDQLKGLVPAFDYDLLDDEYDQISGMFNTEVREEGLQQFPGLKYNFPRLRRDQNLLAAAPQGQ